MSSFRLPRALPFGDGLRQAGVAEAEAAIERLKEGDVHRTRRRLKQLRALLSLAKGDATADAVSKQVRSVAHALAPARDQAVALATFQSLASLFPEENRIDLVAALRSHRTAANPCATLTPLETLLAATHALTLWKPGVTRKDVCQRFRQTVKKTRRLLDQLSEQSKTPLPAPPEQLHHLRQRFKRLTAQLRLLRDDLYPSPRKLRRPLSLAKETGEMLGLDHDLVVLAAALPEEGRVLIAPVLERLHKKRQRCGLKRGRRFLKKLRRCG